MATRRAPVLLGRAAERELLDRMLHNARGGQSAVLVIRGEAGIGKTALLDHWASQASAFRTARIAGVEAEMDLPFAAVHQLCAPMLIRLDALPGPQRDALSVALGLTSGEPRDNFLVALAVLSLLAAVAEERPMLCVVDDAQWLDRASSQVLGFVARRLLAESVALLFGVRKPSRTPVLEGLPEMKLRGLCSDDARVLLATAVPGLRDDRVRERIIAETRGNPLALLELSRHRSAPEVASGFVAPAAVDLARCIESYCERLGALPKATQRLLLLVAAEPAGDATVLWQAAERLGLGASDLAPAHESALLQIGADVRFPHPLVRSAVYGEASPEDRRSAHAALADACDPDVDADRRAGHRALAAAGPDEEVATELERSAGRAQMRGGLAAAATVLERSTDLTPIPDGARGARWRLPKPHCSPAPRRLRSGCWGGSRPVPWMLWSAPAWNCFADEPRSALSTAATRRGCSSQRRTNSHRSTGCRRVTPISRSTGHSTTRRCPARAESVRLGAQVCGEREPVPTS